MKVSRVFYVETDKETELSMAYFLGLDAGGTKTHCLISDGEGRVVGFGQAGTGSYEYEGVEPAARENTKAVQSALDSAGIALDQVSAIGMGVAGADLPEDYVMLEEKIYTPLFGEIPRVFRNDSMAGLRGGLRDPFGVVVACGTGCVCAGRNRNGDETRVGGLGDEFGDMTSGSSIGREGLETVWRTREGVIPPTRMTDLFLEKAGCGDLEQFFLRIYRREMSIADLEPMAKLVHDAAFEGDSAACDILERHGAYLGRMASACARRVHLDREGFEVVLTGSVFKGRSPVLQDALALSLRRECPEATLVRAAFEPVVGALLLALEIDQPVSDACYDALSASIFEAEEKFGVAFRP